MDAKMEGAKGSTTGVNNERETLSKGAAFLASSSKSRTSCVLICRQSNRPPKRALFVRTPFRFMCLKALNDKLLVGAKSGRLLTNLSTPLTRNGCTKKSGKQMFENASVRRLLPADCRFVCYTGSRWFSRLVHFKLYGAFPICYHIVQLNGDILFRASFALKAEMQKSDFENF